MNKPKTLYHGSQNKYIKVFEPRGNTLPNDWDKGQVVFATPDYKRALKFIVPSDDSWTAKGAFNGEHFIVISDKKRFLLSDTGGAVYQFPTNGFKFYKKGEWYTHKSVKPIKKFMIKNGLKEMIKNGIRVYFTNKKLFKNIQKSKDHGLEILNKMISENEKQGKKVSEFKQPNLP